MVSSASSSGRSNDKGVAEGKVVSMATEEARSMCVRTRLVAVARTPPSLALAVIVWRSKVHVNVCVNVVVCQCCQDELSTSD